MALKDEENSSQEILKPSKKKPGRPSGIKRKIRVGLYFTEEEFAEIKQDADKMRMSINEFIRFKTFNPTQS